MNDIQQLKDTVELLTKENKRLRKKIFDLKAKTSFRVFEENLKLVQEVEKLKSIIHTNPVILRGVEIDD